MRRLTLIAFCTGLLVCQGQEPDGFSIDLIEQRIEAIAEEQGDNSEIDFTMLFDLLNGYREKPLNLNKANDAELAAMQLLSDAQVLDLRKHIKRFGPLLSLYELQVIPSFDLPAIRLLSPFVTLGSQADRSRPSFKEVMNNARHEIMIRSITNIEQRRGFYDRTNLFGLPYTDPGGDALPDVNDQQIRDSLRTNGKVYLGSPYKLYTRYRFRYRNNVSAGITAEKDEGEEFFKGSQQQGFDYYSAHLFIRDIGPLKTLALGDYVAQFGQGLTFWSGLGFGAKSSYTMNIKRNARGLMPYASVNENLFLRGAAASYQFNDFEFTAFYSKKQIDANVNDDASDLDPDVLIISSFQQDGLHRRPIELEKKDAINERIIGGNLKYTKGDLRIGATAAHVDFGAELVRNTSAYNQFEFQGSENTTAGIDAQYVLGSMNAFAEVSRSANGGLAYLTGAIFSPDKIVSLSVLHRNYARDFHGLNSIAFSEGSNPWNERGTYIGLEVRPKRAWRLNAYFDQFDFPWLRFQTDAPSAGHEWLIQLNHRIKRGTEMYVRVRKQDKARNSSLTTEGIDPLTRIEQSNYRFNLRYKVSDAITLRTRMEAVDFNRADEPLEHGFLIYQDLIHRPLGSPWQFTARVALFDMDTYDSRVYAYENDLVGLYSILPYYGRGMRWYLMARVKIKRRVDLWVRYGSWIYNDRNSFSSGLQEINGNRRSDLKAQLRYRF